MSLIAVFSGDHSSAEEIVQQVADRLSYKIVARELLEEAAREFNVAEDKLARALTGSRGFFNALTREWEKSLIYTRAALAQLLRTDEQIYHGPATHLIPAAISHVLRVGVSPTRRTGSPGPRPRACRPTRPAAACGRTTRSWPSGRSRSTPASPGTPISTTSSSRSPTPRWSGRWS